MPTNLRKAFPVGFKPQGGMKPQVEIKQTCTLLVVMKGGHEFLHNAFPYAVGIIIQIYILNKSWQLQTMIV